MRGISSPSRIRPLAEAKRCFLFPHKPEDGIHFTRSGRILALGICGMNMIPRSRCQDVPLFSKFIFESSLIFGIVP